MLDGISLDKKRKRTSIAAPEKRSLEAYFAIQPRPSGEKIEIGRASCRERV